MRRFLLFRNPVFGRFWGARIVSYLGSAATVAVLPLYVYETDGDPISVGILTLAMTLPRLLGPFAGTVSDRMDGKRLMILCDLGQAAMIGLAALLLPPFPVLVLLVAGSATLSTLFFPAGRSAVPALVAPDDLTPANAFLGTAANLGFALGPALGGSAFAVIGARGALAFDAVTFLVSAAFLASLPALPSAPKDGAALSAGFLAEVRDGLRYVSHQPLVRALVVGLFFGITFIAVDTVALVFLARGPLETGGAGYGLLASAHGVGMILGPLLLLRRVRLALVPVVLLGLGFEGGSLLLTGLAPTLLVAFALRSIGGIANGVENVAMDTVLQETVERPMLGRVFGVIYGAVFLAEGLGAGLGSLLLEVTSPRATFVLAGCATLGLVFLVWRMLPRPPVPSSRVAG